MDSVTLVLAMFVAVILSGMAVRALPAAVPTPLVQIALGALIDEVFDRGVRLEPDLFFLVFLPPLLFLDGWRIPKQGLLRDKLTILELALGLVVFTVLGLGFLVHAMIPSMPLPVAFALAAIVSPTDPVAVSAITRRVPIPRRVMHVLEGESLLNDATGLVAFRFAVTAAVTGSFSLASAALSFLWVATAGAAIGAGLTWAVFRVKGWFVRRYGEDSSSQILLSLLIPFGAYGVAEHFQASGILAAVAAGITISYVELAGTALAATRVQGTSVWNMVQFTLNGIMFILLGEQLPDIFKGAVRVVEETGHENPWWLLVYALVISVALALLRFAWVWTSLKISRWNAARRGDVLPGPSLRLLVAVSIAGVRGAITLAGVLTLPYAIADGSALPARDLAIFLAATVIILSLVTATVVLPRLLKGLEIPPEPLRDAQEDLARRAVRTAATRAIGNTVRQLVLAHPDADPTLFADAASRLNDSLAHLSIDGVDVSPDVDDTSSQRSIERAMRLAAVREARAELWRLARSRDISDDICRAAIRRLDLHEARSTQD